MAISDYTVKYIIDVVSVTHGRQPENYMLRLINDALMDISIETKMYEQTATADLTSYRRWYPLKDFTDLNNVSLANSFSGDTGNNNGGTNIIDVFKVEILDSDSRYNLIPKLTDPHLILKEDTDSDSLSWDSNKSAGDLTTG